MDTSLRKFYPWFMALGLLVGGLIIAAYYKDQFREWKTWQREYVKAELARAATPDQRARAARTPVEIRQFVLPELDRVDRCMSCHVSPGTRLRLTANGCFARLRWCERMEY